MNTVLKSRTQTEQQRLVSGLTSAQYNVIELLSQGMTSGEIGGRLGICTGTVKSHLGDIYKQLHVLNRVEAVVLFLRAVGELR